MKKKDLKDFVPLWDSDEDYDAAYKEIQRRMKDDSSIAVGRYKGYIISRFAQSCSALEGDMAEVGVYRGGSAFLLAKLVPNKTWHLFDTFDGIYKINPKHDDDEFKGSFRSTSLKKVQDVLCDCKNVEFYPGWFPDTADPVEDKTFSFVHADADVFPSTRDICKFFYPRLVKHGMIIFDDYGYHGTPGAKKAVDQFFNDKPENPIVIMGGQAIIIKL